jgi:hypothetical protein
MYFWQVGRQVWLGSSQSPAEYEDWGGAPPPSSYVALSKQQTAAPRHWWLQTANRDLAVCVPCRQAAEAAADLTVQHMVQLACSSCGRPAGQLPPPPPPRRQSLDMRGIQCDAELLAALQGLCGLHTLSLTLSDPTAAADLHRVPADLAAQAHAADGTRNLRRMLGQRQGGVAAAAVTAEAVDSADISRPQPGYVQGGHLHD